MHPRAARPALRTDNALTRFAGAEVVPGGGSLAASLPVLRVEKAPNIQEWHVARGLVGDRAPPQWQAAHGPDAGRRGHGLWQPKWLKRNTPGAWERGRPWTGVTTSQGGSTPVRSTVRDGQNRGPGGTRTPELYTVTGSLPVERDGTGSHRSLASREVTECRMGTASAASLRT